MSRWPHGVRCLCDLTMVPHAWRSAPISPFAALPPLPSPGPQPPPGSPSGRPLSSPLAPSKVPKRTGHLCDDVPMQPSQSKETSLCQKLSPHPLLSWTSSPLRTRPASSGPGSHSHQPVPGSETGRAQEDLAKRPEVLCSLKAEAWAKLGGCTPRGRMGGGRASTARPHSVGVWPSVAMETGATGVLGTMSVTAEGGWVGLPPAVAGGPQVVGRGAFPRQVPGRAWGWGRGEAGTPGSVLVLLAPWRAQGLSFILCEMAGGGGSGHGAVMP